MSARRFRNGYTRTSTPGYQRDRRLARRVLPRRCNRCGRDDVPLELDHILSVADHTRIYGEPPEDGTCTAADVHERYQFLCRDHCHKLKTKAERARGQRAGNARRAGRRPPPVHPSEVLGGGTTDPTAGVWPRGGV